MMLMVGNTMLDDEFFNYPAEQRQRILAGALSSREIPHAALGEPQTRSNADPVLCIHCHEPVCLIDRTDVPAHQFCRDGRTKLAPEPA